MAIRTGPVGMIGRTGGSGKYTADDFKAAHPEFFIEPDPDLPPPILKPPSPAILDMHIQLAHASIPKNLYKEAWRLCMGLYIAHLIARANQIAVAAKGAPYDDGRTAASESVGSVSISYDTGIAQTLADDFGELAQTIYGQQLIYFVRMVGIGGLYV